MNGTDWAIIMAGVAMLIMFLTYLRGIKELKKEIEVPDFEAELKWGLENGVMDLTKSEIDRMKEEYIPFTASEYIETKKELEWKMSDLRTIDGPMFRHMLNQFSKDAKSHSEKGVSEFNFNVRVSALLAITRNTESDDYINSSLILQELKKTFSFEEIMSTMSEQIEYLGYYTKNKGADSDNIVVSVEPFSTEVK